MQKTESKTNQLEKRYSRYSRYSRNLFDLDLLTSIIEHLFWKVSEYTGPYFISDKLMLAQKRIDKFADKAKNILQKPDQN